jgi:GH43 family beta-xylosidase
VTFKNPIIPQRADPSCMLHGDGFYYFTATVPEYDRIELRRAKSIDQLGAAEAKVIWRKHATGAMGSHIWAPEIHFIDEKWYIYFAAGGAEKVWDIRIYVLENTSPNPLEGEWIERGRLDTGWESFSLDATTFVHRDVRYLVWAQHDNAIRNNTNLYIARMGSPLTISGKAVMISKPDLDWERRGFRVNEGPAVLIRNGRIFMTYSASATDANYCMGLLTASADSDPLDPKSWTKSPEPVMVTEESCKAFGPGHNCFTTTPDGKLDIMLYHCRDYREIRGDPLNDPNRATRAQQVLWTEDGTMNLMAR